MNNVVIRVEDLHVTFPLFGGPGLKALCGIDVGIRRSEILGLVGESGAGKTVLARSIMGLVPFPGRITQGRVLYDGDDLMKKDDEEFRNIRGRHMAMIVPNPRGELNPLLTVGKQLVNMAKAHLGAGKRDAAERAMEILKSVSIPDPERRFHAFPHELSGGMAQRIVIANALICSPEIIISDDATSGLDVTVQAQILDLLSRLVKENDTAVLFITRDIGIAAHFCDKVAIICMGEIVELADTMEFFDNPRHPYSIMLLASFSHSEELKLRWTKARKKSRMHSSKDGCKYALRCVRSKDGCFQRTPFLQEVSPGHLVRCHI